VINSIPLNPDYGRVIGFNFPYQNDEKLSGAIRALSSNPKGKKLDKVLKRISKATTESLDETKKQYKRFQEELQKLPIKEKQRILKQIKNVKPEYLGSLQQLRFGQLLTEHLDLNPVFSALLSPTGGLIGPGSVPRNIWFYSEKGILAYHAAVHDAAGFLCNRQSIMPGYEYITNDEEPCETSPLAGQVTGILYWYRKLKKLRRSPRPSVSITDTSVGINLDEQVADIWVELEPAELLFVLALIGARGEEYSDEELEQLKQGEKQLIERNLIIIDKGKYEIDDDLVALIAVSENPQKKFTTKLEGDDRSETISQYYQAEEFIVEESYPQESVKRFSFLIDKNMIGDRILEAMKKTTEIASSIPETERINWNEITVTSFDFIEDVEKTEAFTLELPPLERALSPLESNRLQESRDRLNIILGGI